MKLGYPKQEILTASEAARRLDVPAVKLIRAIHSGKIVPTGRAGRVFFFTGSRLPSLARALACLLIFLLFETSARASLPYFAMPYSLGTNTFPGGGAPGGTTNYPPYTWVVTNASGVIISTNGWSGWIDASKEKNFCVQTGLSVAAGPGTNISNIIFRFEPSLDGVNPDISNTSYYVTNGVSGAGSLSGLTNSCTGTANFDPQTSGAIGWFYLSCIVNPNTNGFQGTLSNATVPNLSLQIVTVKNP